MHYNSPDTLEYIRDTDAKLMMACHLHVKDIALKTWVCANSNCFTVRDSLQIMYTCNCNLTVCVAPSITILVGYRQETGGTDRR